MAKGLKNNFIYNSILTASNYLFPLLIYPYISRVLGLSNIGIVNFVDNLINYFVFLSMMGITTVGVREIAAARATPGRLNKTFMSLFMLTAITTFIAMVVLGVAMYTVPTLTQYRDLLYVGQIKLLFNLFMIEWLFTGMENFKYITNRSLIIRCLYVVCVFLFVRDASDYKLYYEILVAMVVINATVNFFYSRKFIRYSFKGINLRPYYRAFLIMGAYMVLANVYVSLNPVWLGFVTDTDQVGYFTTATKLHALIMAVLLSFTNIVFPRVSNLLAEGKEEEYWEKISTAFDAICLFIFPTMVYMLVAGPELLHFVVGDGFEGSYTPLRIITPLILVIGIEQILVIQILMAKHQDKTVLLNSFLGAVVAMLFNVLLTAQLGADGSAIVWVLAESSIMLLSILAIYKKFHYLLPYKRILTYCFSYAPLLLILVILYNIIENDYAIICLLGVITVIYSVINEAFVVKNKVLLQLVKKN